MPNFVAIGVKCRSWYANYLEVAPWVTEIPVLHYVETPAKGKPAPICSQLIGLSRRVLGKYVMIHLQRFIALVIKKINLLLKTNVQRSLKYLTRSAWIPHIITDHHPVGGHFGPKTVRTIRAAPPWVALMPRHFGTWVGSARFVTYAEVSTVQTILPTAII